MSSGRNRGCSLRVALGGFGAIGRELGTRLDQGVEGLELAAVSARDTERAKAAMVNFRQPAAVMPLADLSDIADIVVECAPASVFRTIAEPALKAGKVFMPLSSGALLQHDDLIQLAKDYGSRIVVPTGALLGLDAVRAAAEGTIHSVQMVTRKPPNGLAGAPYLEEHGIDLSAVKEPIQVFAGSAREGARGFPANVNVAAALALAGIGPDRTQLEIWADPSVQRNTHRICVDADSVRFDMTIENVPSEANPRTGKITALSALTALKTMTSAIRIGS